MDNIKEQLEEVIKKNLPKKKRPLVLLVNRYQDVNEEFNECLSQINTSLIADEVLKVVVESKRDFIIRILGEQHKNELQGKGYDFYFVLRTELDNLSPNKENENNG